MSYPHQAEIRQWLENWARWSPGTFGQSQWREATSSRVFESGPIPVMGGEAADTHQALQRLGREERSLLTGYHLSRVPIAKMARRRKISMDTLERRLHAVHEAFYEQRRAVRHEGQRAAARNREAAPARTPRATTTAWEDVKRLVRAAKKKLSEENSR